LNNKQLDSDYLLKLVGFLNKDLLKRSIELHLDQDAKLELIDNHKFKQLKCTKCDEFSVKFRIVEHGYQLEKNNQNKKHDIKMH
jgi:hypothetical protein